LSIEEQRALLAISIAMGWGLALLLAALAGPLAAFYRQPGLAPVLRILSLSFVLVPFSSQVTAMLRRGMRAGALLRISVFYSGTQFAATIALAATGLGPCALAWGVLRLPWRDFLLRSPSNLPEWPGVPPGAALALWCAQACWPPAEMRSTK
jgi:O-antigen/teichoic acid export membrane protein